MYTQRLLILAAQGWLGLAAAPPPGAAGVQTLQQPGAAASTAAATSLVSSVEGVPVDTLTATSAPSSAAPSQSPIIMPPQMNVCQEEKNVWAGGTIQQRSPVPNTLSGVEPQPIGNLLEKRRYREAPPRALCFKVGEFDFFNYNGKEGNTQTITLSKNIIYTLIVYASAKVTGITTYNIPKGQGWTAVKPAKANAQLVSYETWVPDDGAAHFQIRFASQGETVHGKVVLYQLPIAPPSSYG